MLRMESRGEEAKERARRARTKTIALDILMLEVRINTNQ